MRLERTDHLPDGRIHEFDLTQHTWCGIARGVGVASLDSALDQLLSNANGLVIHAENRRHRSVVVAEVSFAINLVDDGVHLQLVIAFNRVEAGGPVVAGRVRNRGAIHAGDCFEVRNRNDVGIHFGRIVIVHVAGTICSGRPGNGGVDGVLVRPSRIAAGGVDHAVDRIGTDKVPGINGLQLLNGSRSSLIGLMDFTPPSNVE